MQDAIAVMDSPAKGAEAYESLLQIAGRRTLHIPAEILVRSVLALPGEWDWPVRRAALEAILRRVASISTQEIAVVSGPRRDPWGRYVLGRADADGTLPYDVRLASLVPVRGSCDCADFLRGALGLCKHLLAVLEHLARRPRAFGQKVKTPMAPSRAGQIVWDATRAPPASTDPLEGLCLSRPHGNGHAAPAFPSAIAGLFHPTTAGNGSLKATHIADPEARMHLVRSLQAHARKAHASVDPAARAVLVEERTRLERLRRLRVAAPRIRQALGRAKRRLYSYQKEGIRRFLAEGRLVLADDMGLGKTTQAIVGAGALYDARVVRRGLLVVPASLKPQWEREWQAVSDAPLRLVEGGAEDRRSLYRSTQRGFLVTNYEQVVRDFDVITAWAPDLVVLDEAQRIKNWATKTALIVKRLKPDFRLVLTGTPMENRLEELASIVEWVDDRALEPKWRLVPWHSTYADGKQEVIGARNLDLLRKRLAPVLLRRVRSEVLSQLPVRQDTVIPVELTAEQREAHDDLNQPIAKLARIAQRRPLTQGEFLRLMSLLLTQRVIANGMAQLNFLSTWPAIRDRAPEPKLVESLAAPKLVEFRELVSNLVVTQKRKIVVFSQWRRMLELAAWSVSDLLLSAGGLRALFFTGQEGARRRTQNLVDFHDDPQTAILFLTDAGGVGLNLQKAANACVNLELPWNPAVLEQRIGRIHRLGQKRPIDVYNLVSRACIEERIAGLVAGKRALFKGLFDGTTDQIQFDRAGALGVVLERLGVEPAAGHAPAFVGTEAEDQPGVDAAAPAPTDGVEAMALADDDVVAQSPVTSSGQTERSEADAPSLPSAIGDAEESVGHMLRALSIKRSADGGIRIEAPSHAARALMSLFEGMARLLGTAMEPTAAVPTATESISQPIVASYPITASTGKHIGSL
ncbi:MAG TPA: DEAD/DEAH box helicase [Polyangia bacterium]|jgi:superfamily II DNA or RNA helicase|nr:DEAD/DEAH box helicase [Polyangia bacterium]